MKETKSEIYKIFKESLKESIFDCNKRSLSIEIDTAVKKSAVYLLHALKEGNISELQKEYTLLKADFRNIGIVLIILDSISTMIVSATSACFSSLISAIYVIVPVLLGMIKDFYEKEITEPNLSVNIDGIYTMIYILLGISVVFAIVKAILEVANKESSIVLESFNKKIFDTTYRDKYIKILSQMVSDPNKFEKMDYFEFTKWTRCFIFNEPEN
jgi:hypothetical protein